MNLGPYSGSGTVASPPGILMHHRQIESGERSALGLGHSTAPSGLTLTHFV